jgi:hypothetical protein
VLENPELGDEGKAAELVPGSDPESPELKAAERVVAFESNPRIRALWKETSASPGWLPEWLRLGQRGPSYIPAPCVRARTARHPGARLV